jgi:HEPN domain-containing protein/predicted nucleotidyltransferase
MATASPFTDALLANIAQTIVDECHPSRIVLFGSRARGDARAESDYDLLVELSTECDVHQVRRAVDKALAPFLRLATVDVKVRRPGDFERRRDDPGTIDYDVAREGVILVPAGERGPVPSDPRAQRVREAGREPPESVERWLGRADADLRTLDQLLSFGSPVWMSVTFHAQQAAEKYLKALVISRWRKPPRTHELAPIVDLARAIRCTLPDLAAECEILKPYGVEVRSPDDQPMSTEAEGRVALAAAMRIVDVVRPLVASGPAPVRRPY